MLVIFIAKLSTHFTFMLDMTHCSVKIGPSTLLFIYDSMLIFDSSQGVGLFFCQYSIYEKFNEQHNN